MSSETIRPQQFTERGEPISAEYLNRVADSVVQRLGGGGIPVRRVGTGISLDIVPIDGLMNAKWLAIRAATQISRNRWRYTAREGKFRADGTFFLTGNDQEYTLYMVDEVDNVPHDPLPINPSLASQTAVLAFQLQAYKSDGSPGDRIWIGRAGTRENYIWDPDFSSCDVTRIHRHTGVFDQLTVRHDSVNYSAPPCPLPASIPPSQYDVECSIAFPVTGQPDPNLVENWPPGLPQNEIWHAGTARLVTNFSNDDYRPFPCVTTADIRVSAWSAALACYHRPGNEFIQIGWWHIGWLRAIRWSGNAWLLHANNWRWRYNDFRLDPYRPGNQTWTIPEYPGTGASGIWGTMSVEYA